MKTTKNLGIWMDHANAHLMDFTTGPLETIVTVSNFPPGKESDGFERGEKTMHHKEQQHLSAYYKKLGEAIINYESVILFGPTDAKVELFNRLREDHLFEKIKIEVIQADKMSTNQQHAFVKEHFAGN